ncbi:MAG: S41 family peptidase, partial [Bacteroidetes bacterium]|nr:S41 family peptidase [Bacteroidota bacterium]
VSPISGGPSEKLGIMAGDRIVEIDGKNVAGIGLTNNDVRKMLRGEKGSQVNVKISRKGAKNLLDFLITRDKIPIFSKDASYMVDDSIGYIKLNRFARTTMDEFNEGLASLKQEGMKHLILDLRDNAGGYMNMAIDLADEFLDNNKMIVYTEGEKSPKHDYKSTDKGDFEEGKLIVLVDGGSASASEIVSGAVQDWDRGVIIGRRTFGKGLVQRPFNLTDGSKIRLTIAKYYTPSGRLIQKPYDKGIGEYAKDRVHRYESGELTSKDSIHFPDSLKYNTLVSKRTVYGGGGIMPDIFVPLDTTYNSDYYFDLRRKDIISRFVVVHIDKNRDLLRKKYPDFKTFNSNYEITDEFIEELVVYAEKSGVERNEKELQTSLIPLRIQLKALIAKDLWSRSEYFEVFNVIDPGFKAAVEVLHNSGLYESKLLAESGDSTSEADK